MDIKDERKILMDHYTKPDNFGFINDDKAYKKLLKSDSCSDELTVQISYDNDVIKDIHFEGSACVISTSSSDILFSMLKGKNLEESRRIVEQYNNMITKNEEPKDNIELLMLFRNIYKQKNRQKCATLGSNGIIEFINNK